MLPVAGSDQDGRFGGAVPRPPLSLLRTPALFARRLTLKLLAPTALVSLMLVGVCVFGAFYLSSLHVNASAILSENVQSTQAAARLEITAKELMRLLRNGHEDAEAFSVHVRQQNQTAR